MKKIIFLLPRITGRGGTETVVRTVTEQFMKSSLDYRIQIYILGGSDDKAWLNGLNFHETRASRNKYIRVVPYFLNLLKYIAMERPSMVICLSPMLCSLSHLVRRLIHGKFPIISWIHFSLKRNNIRLDWLHKADFHLAISSGIVHQLETSGVPKAKIFLIYNPVQRADQFIPRPSDGTSKFIYIGRIQFEGQKRLKELLDALKSVNGPWQLDIFGTGNDREKCKQYAEKLSIGQKINWHGWQSNPWSKAAPASLLVLTSLFEGLPMVLAEAISRGVYCISSDCETGPADIIRPGINGALYPVGDTLQLGRLLQSIVDGEILPEQDRMKSSIDYLYTDVYFRRFLSVLNDILKSWYGNTI